MDQSTTPTASVRVGPAASLRSHERPSHDGLTLATFSTWTMPMMWPMPCAASTSANKDPDHDALLSGPCPTLVMVGRARCPGDVPSGPIGAAGRTLARLSSVTDADHRGLPVVAAGPSSVLDHLPRDRLLALPRGAAPSHLVVDEQVAGDRRCASACARAMRIVVPRDVAPGCQARAEGFGGRRETGPGTHPGRSPRRGGRISGIALPAAAVLALEARDELGNVVPLRVRDGSGRPSSVQASTWMARYSWWWTAERAHSPSTGGVRGDPAPVGIGPCLQAPAAVEEGGRDGDLGPGRKDGSLAHPDTIEHTVLVDE